MFSKGDKRKYLPLNFRDNLPIKFKKIKNGKYSQNHPDYPIHIYLQDNDIIVEQNNSDIVNFLKGKNILVTGGTGFLGKLLLEKILRACEDVTIFVIVREKKGKTVQKRIDDVLDSHIDLIYHVAATTRYEEPLKISIKINISGTQEVIKLAKECRKLQAFVHVSTAYSNADKQEVLDETYEPFMNPQWLMKMADEFSQEGFDKINSALLQDVPNNYCFTKQIAEHVVKENTKGIPTCMVRPAIVMCSLREPVRGWGEQVFGPMGLCIAATLGLLHVNKADPNIKTDFVPADFVINAIIAASYRTAKEKNLNKMTVYNYVSSPQNPLHWKYVITILHKTKWFGLRTISDVFCIFTHNKMVFEVLKFLCHTLPAYFLDGILICTGSKQRLVKIYQKIHKHHELLTLFISTEWKYENKNTIALWDSLNEVDKRNFNFDITSFEWHDYLLLLLVGIKEYILKESMEDLDKDRARAKRITFIHWSLAIVFPLLLTCVLYYIIRLLVIIWV